MKKYLIHLMLFGFVVSSNAQDFKTNYLKQTLDSTLYTGQRRDIYKWDSLGRNIEWRVFSDHPITHVWMLGSKTTYDYNVNNQMIEEIYYRADYPFVVWNPTHRYEYSYDSNNFDSLKIRYNWSTSSSSWVPYVKEYYTYNSNDQLVLTSSYSWDYTNSIWFYSGKIEKTYNSNNQIVLDMTSGWDSTNNSYQGFQKIIYSYNSKDQLWFEVWQMWDWNFNSTWDDLDMFEYNYDIDSNLQEIIYYYAIYNGLWEASSRSLSYYDKSILSENLLLPVNYSDNDIDMGDFYFAKNKHIYSVDYYPNNQNGWNLSGDSMIYYYSDFNTGIKHIEKENNILVFPNPVVSDLYIKGLEYEKEYHIAIYNLNGRILYNQKISANSISISNLKTGFYVLEIKLGNKLISRNKLIKY